MVGCAFCGHIAVDCHLAPGHARAVASPLWKNFGGLGPGVFYSFCCELWRYSCGCQPGPCPAGRIHTLHCFVDRTVHRGRWHPYSRQSAWYAGAQCGNFDHWRRAGEFHGHHGRFHVDAASADPCQRQPRAQGACDRVFHLHRLQCRWITHPLGRPALVFGFFEGR